MFGKDHHGVSVNENPCMLEMNAVKLTVAIFACCVSLFDYVGSEATPVRFEEDDREHIVGLPVNGHVITETQCATDRCMVFPVDPTIHQKVLDLVRQETKLINFFFKFVGYSSQDNPLLLNMSEFYRGNTWSRAHSRHGRTLLTLAFNYDILSLTMLSIGRVDMTVNLDDSPRGCLAGFSEMCKVQKIRQLLFYDLIVNGTSSSVTKDDYICNPVIKRVKDHGHFVYKCCTWFNGEMLCTDQLKDGWVTVLDYMIITCMYLVILFAPLAAPRWVYTFAKDQMTYVLKLGDNGGPKKLQFTVHVSTKDPDKTYLTARHVLEIRDLRTFPKLTRKIREWERDKKLDQDIRVETSELHLAVDLDKTLTMHNVPIGFPHFISRMFCQCKLAKEPGCSSFCRSSVWGCLPNTDEIYCTWLHVGKCLGIMILVACALPLPFIIRLGLYFLYEQDEVLLRKAALHSLHLHENYEENLLQYLTPFHPALVCAYLFYFLCCTVYCLAYNNVRGTGMVRRIVKTSFEDLMGIKYGQVLQRLVAVVLLPLERFGVCGFLFGLLYWPVVVPVCLIMVPFYCLPTLYLSIRMLFNSQMSLQRFRSKPDQDKGQRFERPSGSQLKRNLVHGMKRVHNLLGNMNITHNDSEHHHKYRPHVSDMSCYGRTRKIVLHLAAAFVCICFLYSVLIMLAESAYLGTEVFALTLMGAIINAGTTLKFLSLVALIVLYAYDALNDVYKTYLELNQSIVTTVYNLANEVAYGGIEQGSGETNKPRTAFQLNLAEHKVGKRESYQPDGLSTKGSRRNHYHVNNLCLLMDSNDTARIPIDLFYRMCEIDISHSPGPIERRVWGALGYLFLITLFIGFVFIVVGTFGNLYNISTTNQTLASLAGGALPFFLRSFCKPPKLDGSYKTAISFRRRFDETIATYSQSWPIADLDVTEVKETEDGSCSEWAPICYVDSAVAVQETGAPVPMKELVVEQKPSNLFDRLTDAIRSGLGSRGSLDSISSSDDDGKSNSLLAFSGVSSVADITSGENGVIFDFADGSVTMVDSRPDILIKIDKRTLAKLNGNHPDVKRKLRHHYDEIDLGNSDDVRTFNKISDNNDCVSNESEGTDL